MAPLSQTQFAIYLPWRPAITVPSLFLLPIFLPTEEDGNWAPSIDRRANQIFETQKQVTFRTAPTVTFANPRNGNFCNTETAEIALTGTPGGGTFSGPGISAGTSMFTPRNVPAANQGSPEGVRLSYTVTSGGGCTVTSFTCGVYPPPVSRFVPQNSPHCKDGEGDVSVTFSNTSTPAANASILGSAWNFGDGGTSSLLSGQHSYRAAGTYNVTLTVTGEGGCTDSRTAPI